MMVLNWLMDFSPLTWLYRVCSTEVAYPAEIFSGIQAACMAVLLALLLDRLVGEPPAWLHPVVGMGKVLGLLGKKIAPCTETSKAYPSFLLGAMVWCALGAIVFAFYAMLQRMFPNLSWWWQGMLWGIWLKPLFAWRMLRSEVLAVEAALQHSLSQGRERLSWLVSRDTTQLDAGAVRESAIETLAENLSDSVVAPLLWFAIAGLPGAALYRFANTADAMWGYTGWRGQGRQRRYWLWAGKWAARADDVLNWIPARLTAALLALVAGGVSWRRLRRDAGLTTSPNGGWPMGVMALALGVRLGKPYVYVLNADALVPHSAEVYRASELASKVVKSIAVSAFIAMVLLGIADVGHV